MATARLLGASIKRVEDPRFITGKGNYTDDLKLAGMTYAVFVRSPHANAKIRKIDTAKASKAPGVVAIFTGKDMTGVNSLPCGWLLPELKIPPHMPLASDAARYVGDPVAIVIAETPVGGQRRGRDGGGRLGGPALGDGHREGGRQGHAADPRGGAEQRGLQVADRRRGGHRGGLQVGARRRQEADHQPAPGRQLHGAARVRGPLRGRDRRVDPLGHLAEPARAPAPDDRVRAGHPRAQGAGDRARRGRRLRLQDLPLQRGDGLHLGHQADQAADPLDVVAPRGLPDRRARTRPRDRRRGGGGKGRQAPGAARQDHREPGRLPLDVRAGGPDLSLRHAAERRVRVARDPRRGHRRLHQHHAGGRLPRGRPARGLLPARAHDGRRRGRAQDGPGRDPPEELHPEVRQRLPDEGGAVLRQRQLRRRARQAARHARLQEVPRRADGGPGPGPAHGHRLLDLHRGVQHRAVQGRGLARRPGRPLGVRQGAGASHRQGQRVHRLPLARAGARDDLRPDRGRPARDPDGRRGDRPRRHRPRAVRHGHLRQPLGLGGRHRHRDVARQDQGEGQEDRRPPARGESRRTWSTWAASSW